VYSGAVIPTRFDAAGRAISSSSEVAVMVPMLNALALQPGHRVLEIGAGTGYNAALLAELVGDRGRVTTIDIDEPIAAEARAHLAEAGYARVEVGCGDGWNGWASGAPFDRIEVTASANDLSPQWNKQLVEGGLLCVPFLFRPNAMTIPIFRKEGDSFRTVSVVPGGFMPLRGDGAPADATRRIGEWRITAARPVDEAKLEALLRERPSVEIAGDLNWNAVTLLAFSEPDAVTIAKVDRPSVSIGIFDGDGLAVVETGGGVVAGWRMMFTSVGAPSALIRLRERMAALAARTWAEIEVVAVPTGSDRRPEGTIVIERPNYTFGVRLPE
jgi:protein-L-isoaspartate(D-aspartate) O-methyltransferase